MSATRDNAAPDGFVDRSTVLEMFEVPSRFVLRKAVEGFGIETIELKGNNRKLYKLEDVKRAISDMSDFYDTHYFSADVRNKMVSDKNLKNHNIYPTEIPEHYIGLLGKTYNAVNKSKVFRKDVIDELLLSLPPIEQREEKVFVEIKEPKDIQTDSFSSDDEYVDSKKVMELLGFISSYIQNKRNLKTLRESNCVKFKKCNNKFYYRISDIENIIAKRNRFFEEYIPVTCVDELYFNKVNFEMNKHRKEKLSKEVTTYKIPEYCVGLNERFKNQYIRCGAFKISELDNFVETFNKEMGKKVNTDIKGEDRYDTFLLRLNDYMYWNGFNKETIYTNEKVLEFIKRRLNSSKKRERDIDDLIRDYIVFIVELSNGLNNLKITEVYLLSNAQIQLIMNSIQSVDIECIFYKFLKEVNSDFKKLGYGQKLRFDINNIENPKSKYHFISEEDFENLEKDIYDFETYSKVFNYLIDVDVHIPKIIEEINSTNSIVYASVWLYCMLHLNNAWRNGDCDRFPELVIKDLLSEFGIDDILWFSKNRLTLPQAKSVIFRVRQWEMRMSKTQMKGAFFCSDELAPAFSTAVIILSLYKYNNNIIDDYVDEENKLIMNFGNEHNEVTKTMLNNLFKSAKIKKFKFSSRKFNRTIMTYVYLLANLSGDAKALVYAQELRKHLKIESTMNYVDFDISKVEALGRQLFERGEFGYVATLLCSKVLCGEELGSFEEMTNKVVQVNKAFGGVQGIIDNTRFLNNIRSERQLVVDMISEKSFRECQEILTDMFARNLSSKCGSDIQCLFGHNACKMPQLDGEYSCFDCPYHIPFIYALSRLCSSLVDNLKDYLGIPRYIKGEGCKEYLVNNPNASSKLNKRTLLQTGLKIERRKVLLKEAIDKYGKNYVYQCLGVDRDDFILLSNLVKCNLFETFPQLSANKTYICSK